MESATRGFPSHLGRLVREGLDDLVRCGLVVARPTNYGIQVSLNRESVKIIHTICDWYKRKVKEVDDLATYEIEIAQIE